MFGAIGGRERRQAKEGVRCELTMVLGTDALLTAMRPLVAEFHHALQRSLDAGLEVPTKPAPRIEAAADGSGRQWVETEIDFQLLRREVMPSLVRSGALFDAEALVAQALRLGPHSRSGSERSWTPQGQVVDVFLEDYLSAACVASEPFELPVTVELFEDPIEASLRAEIGRLQAFLAASTFSGQLVVAIAGVTITQEDLHLDSDVSIVPFSTGWRDELWRIAGWGSMLPQPLQAHDFYDISHAIRVDVTGERLGGWNWAAGQTKADRTRIALLLCGASNVRTGISWLRPDDRFASYLSRLGAGSGLVRQPAVAHALGRTAMTKDQGEQIPGVYAQLKAAPEKGPVALALRRLISSSERQSPEDRLIDCWIAFEALFAHDSNTELRFRATLRIARYVGRDAKDRRDIFHTLRQAYDWRSRIDRKSVV